MAFQRQKLGELLVDGAYVTQEQVEEALRIQNKTGRSLGQILVDKSYISEEELGRVLSGQLDTPYIHLDKHLIDPLVVHEIPEETARKHKCIALFKVRDTITVAMVNPKNVFLLDDLRYKTKCKVKPVICSESAILDAIDEHYGSKTSFDDIMDDLSDDELEIIDDAKDAKREAVDDLIVDEAPVIKLVNMIFAQAVKESASDIHIEPDLNVFRIRFRVDGILREVLTPPVKLHPAVVSRIKIMSGLDIAERRIPQDGRLQIKMRGREIDMRVSVCPTVCGEKCVLRLLDKSKAIVNLDIAGFEPGLLKTFRWLIRSATGIVLVTGPTGSGKTTTLYSALSEINDMEKNICTSEDPVEYQLELINQVQINRKVNLTFSAALRSFLRQDPDVILVGEIRDKETGEIAIKAALTGHLVFSTLHTNDAPSAITRMLDMGIEPFLISSAVRGILAQRLVRRICPRCKEEVEVAPELLEKIGVPNNTNTHIYKGRGKNCTYCGGTGYKGRTVVTELLSMNTEIQKLILERASANTIRDSAKEYAGLKTLREDGIRLILEGTTTIDEVLRVTQEATEKIEITMDIPEPTA